MFSRPATSRGTATNASPHPRSAHDRPGADRPLPPLPSSSLPTSYDIPSLRQKPQPDPTNGTPARHSRSVSHPFPSFFGGKKMEKRQHEDDFDSSDGGTPTKADVSRSKSGLANKPTVAMRADREPQTGKCMTCDSTVRWPRELKVFRCTTCLTVNDLEPYDEQRPGGTDARQAPMRKPMAISLDRTKRMIDHCLNEYFEQLLNPVANVSNLDPNTSDPSQAAGPHMPPHLAPPRLETRQPDSSDAPAHLDKFSTSLSMPQPSNNLAHESQQTSSVQHDTPETGHDRSRNASSTEGRSKDASVAIFRTLESYIAGCCTGCTAFNISFFSVKPQSAAEDKSNPAPTIQRQNSDPIATTPQLEIPGFISELDAKVLLLGDVVENGSWWTGNRTHRQNTGEQVREKSPERWRGVVSAKTPRINWAELAEWYQVVTYAGMDWHRKWISLQPKTPGPQQQRWQSIPLSRLQHEIHESQLHLQRNLLKATENLLKRPRRPLKNPEDCRFLLMLLANPLLYSSSQHLSRPSQAGHASQNVKSVGQQPGVAHPSPPKSESKGPRNKGGLGHHSGIIKRIFGLIAHLPNEVHQFFVSWISRFSDGHFQKLVDTVSSFVTYRLTRQQDRVVVERINPTAGLVPSFSNSGVRHASEFHAALGVPSSSASKKKQDNRPKLGVYSEDWQVQSAAKVMALLFQANSGHYSRKRDLSISRDQRLQSAGLNAKYQAYSHGQIVPINMFYNTMLDHADLIADFETWEVTKSKFTFCQYPFFLSIWAKIRVLEHDARRQMEVKAREAFFDSILSRKAVSQYLVLKVRRDCLVDDSLRGVSEVVGSGSNDIKKGLRIDFVGEEGIDAGGLRKEWFLSLVREIFDPHHGLFVYDEDSQYCYFNPFCFESSEQFFLVGVLLGLAIYNSTILDIAFPPFVFKKLMASAPATGDKLTSTSKVVTNYSLEDLAEFRPALAKGLRQLLEYDGDVQETFCRDFVIETDRYGEIVQVPLCSNGHKRPVTNSNRREFVDAYVRYTLDTAVVRQYEPFKRGFFIVCGGNALSLFRPEEIELLVRGSDEPLDVTSLRAVASYDNWPKSAGPSEEQAQVVWFWEFFQRITPSEQRKLLGFITGSDRIPAMGTTNLNIRLQLLRDQEAEELDQEIERFPIARTCFNTLGLYKYSTREKLEAKLWMAVQESEGFGLK